MSQGSADYRGYVFKRAFFESLSEYHPFQDIRKFSRDVLLVHGISDEVVPVDYSFLYQKVFWLRSEGQCEKEIILQADHTFSSGESARQAVAKTIEWLQYFSSKKKEWHGWSIYSAFFSIRLIRRFAAGAGALSAFSWAAIAGPRLPEAPPAE